ncbi:hypothetical protein HDU97_008820 [Phlyctochytrium planicorne]|nr:hypothetical protein HDU97_008820 [Phlyctochytrium planicorne]
MTVDQWLDLFTNHEQNALKAMVALSFPNQGVFLSTNRLNHLLKSPAVKLWIGCKILSYDASSDEHAALYREILLKPISWPLSSEFKLSFVFRKTGVKALAKGSFPFVQCRTIALNCLNEAADAKLLDAVRVLNHIHLHGLHEVTVNPELVRSTPSEGALGALELNLQLDKLCDAGYDIEGESDIRNLVQKLKFLEQKLSQPLALKRLQDSGKEISCMIRQGRKVRKVIGREINSRFFGNYENSTKLLLDGSVSFTVPMDTTPSSTAPIDTTTTGDSSPPPSSSRHYSRTCYICRTKFKDLHFFYDALCPDCAKFNFEKRDATADLTGKFAIVTGGRVKIGFEAALRLLRAGATVLVTSRFPKSTVLRSYAILEDYDVWKSRLLVYGNPLDLMNLGQVFEFINFVKSNFKTLDILVNNAAQTIRRDQLYYQPLLLAEANLSLLNLEGHLVGRTVTDPDAVQQRLTSLVHLTNDEVLSGRLLADAASASASHQQSSLPLLSLLSDPNRIDLLDPDGHFVSTNSTVNSWNMAPQDVPLLEWIQCYSINCLAPILLTVHLIPLMVSTTPSPTPKFVCQVSAVEGQFHNPAKTSKHVQTNIAKAGLNMFVRTNSKWYFEHYGIYMNALDTGWVTDENPVGMEGWEPPLDEVDGAARVLDPVFEKMNGRDVGFGLFYQHYKPAAW